jgi:hypothetical protein
VYTCITAALVSPALDELVGIECVQQSCKSVDLGGCKVVLPLEQRSGVVTTVHSNAGLGIHVALRAHKR